MTPAVARRLVLVSAVVAGALLLTTAFTSWQWVGRTFPGFFVMANRVVPSIALPEWSAGKPWHVFQHQVIAVDGVPVEDAADVYERAAYAPPGTKFTYTVRAPDGPTRQVVIPSRTFTVLDFALLFGFYLVNGLAFVAIGALVLISAPRLPASAGLFSFSIATGIFIITAADLYGPHCFFRLHVIAESLMGASAIHLALVFPTDRLQRRRGPILFAVYAPAVALATAYEMLLWSPSAYTKLHLAAIATQGFGALMLIGGLIWGSLSSGSALVRRRVGLVAAGALAGFLVPALLLATSSALGGSVPLNAAALTAFIFPLSVGYAIVQKDLFEIDVVLRRTLTYAILVGAIAVLYLTVLYAIGAAVPGLSLDPGSRLLLAVLNLAVLFAIAPLRAGVQDAVDRLFFRRAYDADEAVAALSRALSRTRTLEEVVETTVGVLRGTLWPRRAAILLRNADGSFATAPGSEVQRDGVVLPAALEERCARGEILARYEWDDERGEEAPAIWSHLGAALIVPLQPEDGSLALLALDGKESGRAYNTFDVAMLRTAAGQIGLALATAQAFGKLASLNASLEGQVRERTAALEGANADLNASLAELRRAYAQLEQSQASLIRADRLATLGRLAAGIAHEMNTPLGAVMNALQSLVELGREYRESIDDPEVLPVDHQEIAGEIVTAAEGAAAWAKKAASFIRRMKLHVHEVGSDTVERFAIRTVAEEAQTLLAHRLRASRCVVEVDAEPRDASVVGDPSRLGQVLVNLIVNAIDAYEEHRNEGGRIVVRVRARGELVTIDVEDRAGGIDDALLPRIFEELFTTKEAGRGTGLGLCIARSLIEQSFGGTLTVASTPGEGSVFTATVPSRPVSDAVSTPGGPRRRAGEAAQLSSAAASLP